MALDEPSAPATDATAAPLVATTSKIGGGRGPRCR